MLETLVVDGVTFKVDPATNFWGTGDPDRLGELYRQVRGRLLAEVNELRFNTDIQLFYVNPADSCNARCPYCYLPQQVKGRGRNMTYGELEALVKKAAEYFRRKGAQGSIVFHGSEPMLNKKNVFEICDNYRNDLHFGIQTNGTLLTEEDARFIRERRISIGISLDSPFERDNDALRGEGHHGKVAKALGWLRGYSGLSVVTTITNRNVTHLAEMVRFLHGHGVGLCLMNPVRGTQKSALAFRPDPRNLAAEFIKAVEEAIRLTKGGRRIVIGDFANLLLGIVAPSARVMMCDISPCGGGRRFLSVTADGNAYPCGEFIGMEEFCGGNFFTEPVDDVVNSENFLKVRGRAVEDVPECEACLFRNMCGAPCPAEIHSTQGSMFSPSHYCEFYKRVAEHAFRVIHRGDVEHVIRKSALKEIYRLDSGPAGPDPGFGRTGEIGL